MNRKLTMLALMWVSGLTCVWAATIAVAHAPLSQETPLQASPLPGADESPEVIVVTEPRPELDNPVDGPPEPSTLALVGLGMTSLGLLQRRRSKRR
jgi:hypothetical protein